MNWYALIATPVCLHNFIFLLLFIFALSSARHKRGQTFNLFNSIYQSISGHLNRKVNENPLDTEIFVESATTRTKTENKPHAHTIKKLECKHPNVFAHGYESIAI